MAKRKKTKTGVEIKSTLGAFAKKTPNWWLAIIEKKGIHIFSFSLADREMKPIFVFEQPNYREAVSELIRDSAGRAQASYSRSSGGHQTSHPKHAYSSKLSPDEKASDHLFRRASRFLKEEGKKNRFKALALIGHPNSLGGFRKLLDPTTRKKITIQSTHFSNYVSPEKQRAQLLSLIPELTQQRERPRRWLPNQNLKKG